MAYTPITSAAFKARYPQFDAVSGSLIDSIIADEVPLYVDDSWPSQRHFSVGSMLYVAHALTLEGFGTGAEAKAAGSGQLGYKSLSSGSLSITRYERDEKKGAFGLTSYGQRFAEFVASWSVGVAVAAPPAGEAWDWGAYALNNDGTIT